MPATKQELPPEELQRMIAETLEREGRALTSAELHKALPKGIRPASKVVKAAADAMVKSGRIFFFEKRYSTKPDRTLHDAIINELADETRTVDELTKRLRAKKTLVNKIIKELLAEGALHPYPKRERAVPYGVRPPSAAELLASHLPKLLAPLLKTAEKLGIDENDARDALRQLLGGDPAPRKAPRAQAAPHPLLDAIRELNPSAANGALVFLPHLRSAVRDTYPDKTSFDRAVLGLLARGAIEMQSHPTPSLLTAAEREAMIENGRGGWYTAIGLR